jgi:large subunit ribosomal protein L2
MKTFKPVTPARRRMALSVKPSTKMRPHRNLTIKKKKTSGRNAQGRITTRQRGGEQHRQLREVDVMQNKYNVEATVAHLEYDPNRTAFIALLNFADGEKRYFLLPEGVKEGDKIVYSQKRVDLNPGNRTKLAYIPAGTFVHNLEMTPGRGGQIVKSAGSQASIMSKEGQFVNIKLPSGEIRRFDKECMASIGQLSNTDHFNEIIGRAGSMRKRGWRPEVGGSQMNPVDHPHGGGEGHQSVGLKYPKTPWGKHALGVKTRNKKKRTNMYILQRRKK